jgi:dolichol-phosphate mannosyltransferase
MIIALGLIISLSAFLFAFVMAIKALQGKIVVLGYASLIIAVSFFSGIIISVLGIIGLYIGKIFDGIKERPIYLIKEKLNE